MKPGPIQRNGAVVGPEGRLCQASQRHRSDDFFDDWPQTLLTEVILEPSSQGTLLTLKWTPIEFTEAALAMFKQHMDSMTGGWGGSFDKLEAWLAA